MNQLGFDQPHWVTDKKVLDLVDLSQVQTIYSLKSLSRGFQTVGCAEGKISKEPEILPEVKGNPLALDCCSVCVKIHTFSCSLKSISSEHKEMYVVQIFLDSVDMLENHHAI